MPTDRRGTPWPDTTYNDFSTGGATTVRPRRPPPQAFAEPESEPPPPPEPPPRAPRVRRGPRGRDLVIGGVAVALGLGLLFGALFQPDLIGSRRTTPAPVPTAPALPELGPPGTAQVPITINPPPQPEPAPASPGRLETLPPEMAAAAQAARPAPPRTQAAIPAVPRGDAVPQLAVPPAPAPAPPPRVEASFDCSRARPGAEAMVCSDPALAAADRELARAYSRAMQSGIPPENLRLEQQDWVAIREDAARHSRRALASVYNQRIGELNEIARGGGYAAQ